eukprot:Phypoly_transcript_07630.p1 GENE.Phypoly_transcript_07630~~Phypoly_transcript_07630.p1  ORF type:complete len:427 (+),score=96.16 Phypoly_transcript_07630:326-1606(+)
MVDRINGDINSKKSWVDTYSRKGDEANMNKNIKLLEDILEANASVLQDGKGAQVKAEALECIRKGKEVCLQEISKDKLRSATNSLNGKKSWAESSAKDQNQKNLDKYVAEARQILKDNEPYLGGPEGQKLKADTEAWIQVCMQKCASISDNDIRDLKGDVNRLSNWMDSPDKISEVKLKQYLEEAEKLLKEKAAYWDHNADSKAAKAQLEKSIGIAKGALSGKPAPAATPSGSAGTKAAPAPLAGALSKDDERDFISLANRLNSWLSNPTSVMEYSSPEKLIEYMNDAEAGLSKFAAHKSSPALEKYYKELEGNLAKSKACYETDHAQYDEAQDARAGLEQEMQNWSLRTKTVGLKNEDKQMHRFTVSAVTSAGTISSDTSVNTNTTQMGFCCEGDKITLHATKATLIVPNGCTRILVKNNAMHAQ